MTARAYYNEIDPYAAQWLRNLISAGHIAPGDVDERSIVDVQPDDLIGYVQCHFFAGIGGWSRALRLAGWPDDRPVWTGSDSCQPWSVAGKGLGVSDARYLWPVWRKLIEKRNPPVIFGEQSANATEWIIIVRSDLEKMGRAVGAIPTEAACAGARHRRDRWWFVADAERDEQPREKPCGGPAGRVGRFIEPFPWHEPWQSALSRFRAVGDGLPRSVGATDAARNAIVPQVAAEVIGAYMDAIITIVASHGQQSNPVVSQKSGNLQDNDAITTSGQDYSKQASEYNPTAELIGNSTGTTVTTDDLPEGGHDAE